MNDMFIKTAADARKCMGKKVYWDDVSNRYIFLRSGILTEYHNRQFCIDGDFKYKGQLSNLRNFEMGGAWLRNKEREQEK